MGMQCISGVVDVTGELPLLGGLLPPAGQNESNQQRHPTRA